MFVVVGWMVGLVVVVVGCCDAVVVEVTVVVTRHCVWQGRV